MTSNVTATLITLIGCLAGASLALISKGTSLDLMGLLSGTVVAMFTLAVAPKIAENEDD